MIQIHLFGWPEADGVILDKGLEGLSRPTDFRGQHLDSGVMVSGVLRHGVWSHGVEVFLSPDSMVLRLLGGRGFKLWWR